MSALATEPEARDPVNDAMVWGVGLAFWTFDRAAVGADGPTVELLRALARIPAVETVWLVGSQSRIVLEVAAGSTADASCRAAERRLAFRPAEVELLIRDGSDTRPC